MFSQLFTAADHLLPESAGVFETGFTPWDTQQNLFLFAEPVENMFFMGSGSDNNSDDTKTKSYGEANVIVDERKRRRMISNRESARRSRMRKQKHLENLKSQSNRLKIGNRELMNRLRAVNVYQKLLRQDNERLVSESVMLERKLIRIRHALHLRQINNQLLIPSAWPCNNNVAYIYEQNPPSLIT